VEQAGGLVIDGEGNTPLFNRREPLLQRLVGGRPGLVQEVQKLLE